MTHYLEGHGYLVSRLIPPISHIISELSPLLTDILSPHDPPSSMKGLLSSKVFKETLVFGLFERVLGSEKVSGFTSFTRARPLNPKP